MPTLEEVRHANLSLREKTNRQTSKICTRRGFPPPLINTDKCSRPPPCHPSACWSESVWPPPPGTHRIFLIPQAENDPYQSSRKNWRILLLNRSEIGTTNTLQCQYPIWGDHKIGPRTAENGYNYCTALKWNMGRSAHDNLVQWVNLQNRRRAGSSYSHYPSYINSSADAGCGSMLCTNNTSNWPVLYHFWFLVCYAATQLAIQVQLNAYKWCTVIR